MSVLKIVYKHLMVACVLGLITIGCDNRDRDKALKSIILFPHQNQKIWEGEMIYFEGVVSGGISPYMYSWDFGVGILPSSNQKPGKIVFNYEGAYDVLFTVKDSAGHMDFDFIYVVVKRKEVL